MYTVKIAVCSEIRIKHSTQSEHHVEFLNVKTWWYVKKSLGLKRLNTQTSEEFFFFFAVLLTVHLSIILVTNQLNVLILVLW